MGSDRVTVRNLEVVRVDAENNMLVVKGSVPGAGGGYVVIRKPREVETWPRRRKRPPPRRARRSRGQEPRPPEARRRPKAKAAAEAPAKGRDVDRSQIEVVDAENQKVSDVRLHPEVFGVQVNDHLLYEAVKQYRAGGRRGHPHDQEPRPRLRHGEEALAAEGHRARPRRRGPQPALAPRRHRVRTGAPRLLLRHAQEGAGGGPALGAQPSACSEGALQGRRPASRSRPRRPRS